MMEDSDRQGRHLESARARLGMCPHCERKLGKDHAPGCAFKGLVVQDHLQRALGEEADGAAPPSTQLQSGGTDSGKPIDPEGFYVLRGDSLRRFLWEAGGAVAGVFLREDRDKVMPTEAINEVLEQYVERTPEIAEAALAPDTVLTRRPDLACDACKQRIGQAHLPECKWKGQVLLTQTNYDEHA